MESALACHRNGCLLETWSNGGTVSAFTSLLHCRHCRDATTGMKSVEEMKTWIVWMLRTIVVGFWLLMFLRLHQLPFPFQASTLIVTCLATLPPIYAVPMTLALIQFFHQYFNGTPCQARSAKNAGAAAYTVYIIHTGVQCLDHCVHCHFEGCWSVHLLVARENVVVPHRRPSNGGADHAS